MSRRTSPLQKVIAVFVAIAFLIGTAYITGEWPFKPEDSPFAENSTGDKGPQSVDGSGGTYRFDNGVVVTVPKGAVDGDTTLSVGAPKQSPAGGTTPLAGVNRATVAFDVTLAQGDRRDIQPHKALDITVPLEGAMLPAGTSPSQALLYTGVGTGYRFVPATVQGNVLKASLNHLSPKYITYVDEDKFAKAFGIDGSSVPPLNDCKSEVTANKTGKVTFGSGNNGWSNTDKDTPIYACLVAGDDGNPRIGIVNKRYYVLSVATSNDVTVETSPGDTDEELAKAFARTVFPNKKIAAFLGRDGRLVATTPSGSLPARVQLKADPNTFLAESGVFALTFTAGILTGKDSDDLVKTVKALLDIKDVTSCLQQTLDISTGKFDFGFDDAVDLVTSKCMSTIGEALGMPSNPWDLFGKWFQTVGSGLSGGLKAIRTSYEGIRMQTWDGKPPVTVQVEQPVPPCPSDAQIIEAWERDMPSATRSSLEQNGYAHSRISRQHGDPHCVSPWTYFAVDEYNTSGEVIIGTTGLIHFERGRWRLIEFGEQFGDPSTVMCTDRIPAALRPGSWTLKDGSTC